MKKMFFALMAMFAMSFAACGNKTEAADKSADSVVDSIEVVDSAVVDSVVADSVA